MKTTFPMCSSIIGRVLFAILAMAVTSCETIDTEALTTATQQTDNTPTRNVKFKVTNLTTEMSSFDDDSSSSLTLTTESNATVSSGASAGLTATVPAASAAGLTRATLSDAAITDLYVYAGDTLLVHQLSTDSDFGQPNIKLKHGRHELAFIATKGSTNTVTSSLFTPDKVKDTFCKYVTLNVTATTLQQSVSLERYVAGLRLTTEDATTAAIKTCSITFGSYGNALSLPSLTASMDANHVTSITTPDNTFATAGIALKTYMFTPTHGTEHITSIQIDFKDSTGKILFTHTLPSVSFLNNRVTNIHGKFFSSGINNAISLTSVDWSADYDVAL